MDIGSPTVGDTIACTTYTKSHVDHHLVDTVVVHSKTIPLVFFFFFLATKQQEKQRRDGKALAEIDAGLLANKTSVFLHLDQGLVKNLHKPAIISTHQPAGHLWDLLALCTDSEEQEQQNEAVKGVNGMNGNSTYIQSDCLQLSYHQVHCIAQELATGILANGAQPRSTILMLIPNGAEFGLLLWTSIIMRLTITCADPDVLRAAGPDELQHLLRALKPLLVVVGEGETAFAVDGFVEELRLAVPLRICLSLNHSSGAGRSGWKALTSIARHRSPANASYMESRWCCGHDRTRVRRQRRSGSIPAVPHHLPRPLPAHGP